MPLKFHCDCGCQVSVPQHYAGRSIRCPQCKQRVTVPPAEPQRGQIKRFVPLSSFVNLPQPKPPPVMDAASEPQPMDQPQPAGGHSTPAAEPRPHEPPDLSPLESQVLGYQPDRGKVATVYWLAAALVITSLAGLTPGVVELTEFLREPASGSLARWTYVIVFLAVLQLAYAVYLVQLPDWSSTWVVTVLTLLLATVYALVMAHSLLGAQRSPWIELLDLGGRLGDRRVVGWSFIMLCLTSLWSYFGGRFSIRWCQAVQHRARALTK